MTDTKFDALAMQLWNEKIDGHFLSPIQFARRLRAEWEREQAEPVAEGDNGILNWVDGKRFLEHRKLYAHLPAAAKERQK